LTLPEITAVEFVELFCGKERVRFGGRSSGLFGFTEFAFTAGAQEYGGVPPIAVSVVK
jgi:hypothetical protein